MLCLRIYRLADRTIHLSTFGTLSLEGGLPHEKAGIQISSRLCEGRMQIWQSFCGILGKRK